MAENGSKKGVNHNRNRPSTYNKPGRKQALLEIRRLLVEEGLSHTEIQLKLNIPSTTYFAYIDLLFAEEEAVIRGSGNYTYQRLLNESLILNQRYLRRARMLTKIAEDTSVDPEQRIAAHNFASELERAVHDMAYFAPSYLRREGLLPDPQKHYPTLTLSRVHLKDSEQSDPLEFERLEISGDIRTENKMAAADEQGGNGN